jgi:hypothetical protein
MELLQSPGEPPVRENDQPDRFPIRLALAAALFEMLMSAGSPPLPSQIATAQATTALSAVE